MTPPHNNPQGTTGSDGKQPIVIRPAVIRFAEHMEIVLRRNDKKKSWENCTYEYLLNGIERETKELRECFWYPDGRSELFGIVGDDFLVSNRFTEDQVLSECADVANFAMMVFDVLMQREYKNGCASHTSAPAPDTKVDNFKRLAEEHHKLCIEIHNFDNHIHDVIQKGIRICESKYEGEDSINCCNCGVPTTDDGEPDCNECAFSEQHDTAIRAEAAKAEREDVLKELTEKFSELRHEGWNLWKGQEAIDELLGKQPNPCEENGCTDIENCDEICDNRRIYSPVQVAEKVKAAREQDIKILEDYRNSLDYPDCPPGDTIKRLIQSLRQPEPQQEGRR